MTRFRMTAASLIVVGILAAGAAGSHAYAQTQTPAPAAAGQGAGGPSSTDASAWTRKRWSEMKVKWAQEKEKWADCRKKSRAQKLRGRKSWSFIASCMTS